MKKTLLAVVLITALTFVISLYIYSQNRRYYIISTASGRAYKIDRRTGRTWEIRYDRQILVKGQEELTSPQRKAIAPQDEAIWKVRVLYEKEILDELRKKKGNLRITGWKAQRIDEQTYWVSYIFKDDTGEQAWHFEVNLAAGIVRTVGDDPELLKKYFLFVEKPNYDLSDLGGVPATTNQGRKKDIFDEVIQQKSEERWKSAPIVEPNKDWLNQGSVIVEDSNDPELKTKKVRFIPDNP